MLLNVISKLLDRSFQKEPCYNRLSRLESDVWRKVRQAKAASNTISFVMPVWSNTHLRYASLILTMVGGLLVSQTSVKPAPNQDILGLQVFSPNASFLMTSTFTQMDLTSS